MSITKNNLIKSLILIVLVSLSLLICLHQVYGNKKSIIIATATQGGTYYKGGKALTNVLNRDSSYIWLATPTKGSCENLHLLMSKKVDIILCDSFVLTHYLKQNPKIKDNLRLIAALWDEPLQIITTKPDIIKSIKDTLNEKVFPGSLGSGTLLETVYIYKTLGYRINPKNFIYLKSYLDAYKALKNRKITVAYLPGGIPLKAVRLAFLNIPTTGFIKLTKKEIKKLIAASNNSLFEYTIHPLTYPHQPYPLKTISTKALLITHKDTPKKVISELLQKAINPLTLTNISSYCDIFKYVKFKDCFIKNPMIEYHPAAKAYWQNLGYIQ